MAEIDMEKVVEELLAIKAYFASQAIAKEGIIKEVFIEAQQTIENAISMLKAHEAMEQCLKTKCVICPHCYHCDVDENGQLKEQEPVAVYESKISRCACGNTVDRYWHPKFCGYCGKELMWY